MKLQISKEGTNFLVDDPTIPGSPPVGRGRTILEAIGSFFHHNQSHLEIEFEVHESALPAELERRRRALRGR